MNDLVNRHSQLVKRLQLSSPKEAIKQQPREAASDNLMKKDSTTDNNVEITSANIAQSLSAFHQPQANDEKKLLFKANCTNAISAAELIRCIENNNFLRIYLNTDNANEEYFTLAIDQRHFAEFHDEHVANSINMNLTPIIKRRLKDNILGSFQLSNFITSTEGKNEFQQFVDQFKNILKNSKEAYLHIVVYNDQMREERDDSWALLDILQKGLAYEAFGSIPKELFRFSYLDGGFEGYKKNQTIHIQARAAISPASLSPKSSPTFSPATLMTPFESTPCTPPRARFLSLSISSPADESIPPRKKKASIGGIALNIPAPKERSLTLSTTTSSAFPFGNHATPANCNLYEIEEPDSPNTPPMSAVVQPYTLIRPYLYLGSDALPCSTNAIEELSMLKVTHVLNVAADVITSPLLPEKFIVLWLKLHDNLEQEIYDDLKEACLFIDKARSGNPDSVVFVHCKAGKSRSATAVVAYLIWCESMKQKDAYDHVKKLRPEVSPNLGFVMALNRLELEKHGL